MENTGAIIHERKFLIELYTTEPRPKAYPIRYKSDELDLVFPERSLAVVSERKLDQLIKDGDIYQHFRIIRNKSLTDDEIRRMVWEEEIDPAKQIDQWAKPENRDTISPGINEIT